MPSAYTVKPPTKMLFCLPDEAEKQTSSGFYLTEKSADKPKTATVINAGPDSQYKARDWVIFKEFAATRVKICDQDFILITDEDVLGRVEQVSFDVFKKDLEEAKAEIHARNTNN